MKNRYLLALVWIVCSVAYAERADRDQPIEITADKGCSWDQIRDITICEGHVVVIQGTLEANADHVIITRDAQGKQTLVATGKLVTFRQKADDSGDAKDEWITGQAARFEYSDLTQLAILTTNARVKKGDTIVIGDVITYNTETQVFAGRAGATTTANKGRVTAILPPRKRSTAPAMNVINP